MSTPTPPFRYTSPAAVIDVLAPNGQQAGTAAELDMEGILAEIGQAEARTDAELAGRYGRWLPFDPVPDIVARIARDIAAYNCDLTYRGATRLQFGDYDPILMRYRTAIDLLDRIGRGLVELAVPELDVTESSGSRLGVPRNPRGRLFGPCDAYGRRVDRTWLLNHPPRGEWY